MAGPTDVLTEDVKDLRDANRQLTAEIKGVFERLSSETRESNNRLADAIRGLARDFGSFRVEVAPEQIIPPGYEVFVDQTRDGWVPMRSPAR